MASVDRRESSHGTLWRVRWREGKQQRSKHFEDEANARLWAKRLDDLGPALALRLLDEQPDPHAPTVADAVERYIRTRTGITDGTRSDYTDILERCIRGTTLGRTPLTLAGPDEVADWVNGMRHLSGKTVRNRHGLLSAALKVAHRSGAIPVNPAEGMRLPESTVTEMTFLTQAEFAALLPHVAPHFVPFVMFLGGTGVRFGEATALTVGSVSLPDRTARISQAWKHTDGHGHQIGPPKTRRGVRTVVMPTEVADAIRPLVADRSPAEFVFLNRRGAPIRRANFSADIWWPAVHAYAGDVPDADGSWMPGQGKHPRIHDLRHSYASWAIQHGIPLPVLQRQLGHESIETTVRVYGHLVRSDFDALAAVTAGAFGRQALTRDSAAPRA